VEEPLKEDLSITGAEHFVDTPLGMRHHPDHVA
jgi:hypothetical protein